VLDPIERARRIEELVKRFHKANVIPVQTGIQNPSTS